MKDKNCKCKKESENKCSCGCGGERGKCTCTPENNCGCLDENGKCNCTPENNCGCMNNDKNVELENKIVELEQINKDLQTKMNNYLQTASYYKNELDSQKKDFERYKERNKNIQVEAEEAANENLAKKILPIIDDFEQAIAIVDTNLMKGFSMIYTSIVSIIKDLGIVEIETEGELNPEYHNCINTEVTQDKNLDGKIATCYQKGYKFASSNKVVRVATVSVYKA